MKLLIFSMPLVFLASLPVVAQPQAKSVNSEASVDAKTRDEIFAMENRLEQAIAKHDAALLDPILADYYADAYEGSEKAMSKRGVIARCKDGTLPFYGVYMQQKLTQRSDTVTIEGVSNKPKLVSDFEPPEEHLVYVRRVWTKKDGRWLLTVQIHREIVDERDTKKK